MVTGVLKDVLTMEEHQVSVAGRKGRASRKTEDEILKIGESVNISSQDIRQLQHASRLMAKVDTAAIQAGYPLYHHTFFISEEGEWCVIRQVMNVRDRTARRYHWLSDAVQSFVVEPHTGIVGEIVRPRVPNMTAGEAEENRRTCVDLIKGDPNNLVSSIRRIWSSSPPLEVWATEVKSPVTYQYFEMPRKLDWKLFREIYEAQPQNYEELLAFKGVGPATIRALALVSELIYGKPASWRDPVKFSFAHGGKDGVPFPVNRKVMDEPIGMLRALVSESEIERNEKLMAFRRLARFSASHGP